MQDKIDDKPISIKLPGSGKLDLEKGKPLVILGANGSGKTRFSVEIEKLNDERSNDLNNKEKLLIQRVSAQKSLSIPQAIHMSSYKVSESMVYNGSENPNSYKFDYKYQGQPAICFLNNFDFILSFLFQKTNIQLEKANRIDQEKYDKNEQRDAPIKTYCQKVEKIWNDLLPSRKLNLSGNEVHAEVDGSSYHGKEMSDGERVMLYMLAQAISLEEKSILIIDEPELHIHKAILNKFWDKLEEVRKDCVFIYITHDLDFAASRNNKDILWVKSFDGENVWEYEILDLKDVSDLPEELLCELIGTRKKVLFVEGTRTSLDFRLYQEVYKDKGYHLIPCGGCEEVVTYVKAKKGYDKLATIDAIGIIDRDFRTEDEIENLKDKGIYALKVAEVENLFVVPELLGVMEKRLGCTEGKKIEAEKRIEKLYSENRKKQVAEAVAKELTHQARRLYFDADEANPEASLEKINKLFSKDSIEKIINEKNLLLSEKNNIEDILKVFNKKILKNIVSDVFSCKNNEYPEKVINLLRSNDNDIRQRILDALSPYLPEF